MTHGHEANDAGHMYFPGFEACVGREKSGRLRSSGPSAKRAVAISRLWSFLAEYDFDSIICLAGLPVHVTL